MSKTAANVTNLQIRIDNDVIAQNKIIASLFGMDLNEYIRFKLIKRG